MPSPSFQNMRSAPQKQPSPTTAVSRASGSGPFSGVPSTWCLAAVGFGLARPGNASAAVGISSFFLNMNMLISSAWAQYNQYASAAHGLAFSHPEPSAAASRSRKREHGARPTKQDTAPRGRALCWQREDAGRRERFEQTTLGR